MKLKFSRRTLLLALALGFSLGAQAHGPFDNSSQAIVRDDTLELVVTMGMDGAQQFLLNAGLSEADAAAALAGRGPSTAFGLSVNLAPKFFDVTVDGKTFGARGVTVMTDGLEASYTITYPRPVAGQLGLRAVYFNGIEQMKPGSFIATDENRNGLGAAMFTRAQPTVEIKLPAFTGATASIVEAPKPEPPASFAINGTANSKEPLATTAPKAALAPFIWGFVPVLAAAVLWVVIRKRNWFG